ncbi:GNAT family N-acetyltransferase [Pseudomonas japonica]|uniref:Protein ElaA n=1 Tax=Pseudomonas japonica TaxID=256466 RepID=A0A239AT87_9PSED|nr:GNAT family N-acetyltransferase [Pseudomonas japonica]SNR98916.1 ElaA protein [Pseudomonas japonica]
MSVDWICKHHTDLGKEQLYAVLQLRNQVFVLEQKCPYQDLDGQDLAGDTCHLMAWQDDQLLGYLRLLDPTSQGGDVVIGRVVVSEAGRGHGLGHKLMVRALEQAQENWPDVPVYLSAQAHLQEYYRKHGFEVVGEAYLEDGIPHIGMRRG